MAAHHAGLQLLAGPCLKTSKVVSLTIEQAKGIFKTGTNLRTGQQPARMTDRRTTQQLALIQLVTCHKGAVPRMMHPKQPNTSHFYTRNTGTNRLMKLTQLTSHEVQTLIGSPFWMTPANHTSLCYTLLNGVIFNNGVFTAESHNGGPFGLQFLKYAARVLKMFPVTQSYPEDLTSASVSDWISEQLCYLWEPVLPSLRTGATCSQQNRKVSRNKFAYLWQYRRSKAIQVILNNSEYPDPPPCTSDIEIIQTYYDNKCLNQRCNEDLPPPLWCLNVPPPKPTFFPKTMHFIVIVHWRWRLF